MMSLLKSYASEFEPKLNMGLMDKTADAPLVDFVKDSWKSLEVVKNIKIVGFDFTDKESEIDVNRYIFKREKKKKKKERFDYKFVADDRFGKLTVHIQITIKEKNPTTGEMFEHVYPIKKDMLVPLQDDAGYYYIHGKKYYLIYQLVEKSTYTSSNSVTLKSLMPIALKRGVIDNTAMTNNNITDEEISNDEVECVDVNGLHYTLPFYSVFVFRNAVPVILFYMKDGFASAMDFLGVSGAINLVEKIPADEKGNLYFEVSRNRCYLEVNKTLFHKHVYLQSIVGGLLHVSNVRNTIDSFEKPEVWIKKISSTNNLEKGLDILNFFGRLLDKKFVQVKPL